LKSIELSVPVFTEGKPVKNHRKPKSRNTVTNTRDNLSETKKVRNDPLGCPMHPDLALALEFSDAILASAALMANLLRDLRPDASTRVMSETVKLAEANFRVFRRRVLKEAAGGSSL